MFFVIFFPIHKNVKKCQKNRQDKLSKRASERYQNLSEKEKDKKYQYAYERYVGIFLKKEKKRHVNMVVSDIKNF